MLHASCNALRISFASARNGEIHKTLSWQLAVSVGSGFNELLNPSSSFRSPSSFLLTITDLQGREIYSSELNSLTTEINISDFASGMYVVKVQMDGEEVIEKFIKN